MPGTLRITFRTPRLRKSGTEPHWWSDELCELLASGGAHVVRFDNGDVGESTKIETGPTPNIVSA